MKLSSWLFQKKSVSFDTARSLLEEAERLASAADPTAVMDFMESRKFKRISQEIIGPGGSLHGRFLNILAKLKKRVELADLNAAPKARRDWESLPSVVVIMTPRSIDSRKLIAAARSSEQTLVCLMPFGTSASSEHARRQIELSSAFADDPRLAIMLLSFNGAILIRTSFLVNQASDIRADSVGALLEQLVTRAQRHQLHVVHAER